MKYWEMPSFLRELAEKLRYIPATYGVDQGDVEKLESVASHLEVQESVDEGRYRGEEE